MRALNLFCGIGGNRLLWPEHVQVTAVDISPDVLEVYAHYNPRDVIIQGDAHLYLLEHYDAGWDFIWSSPPCQTHSRMVKATRHDIRKYPDVMLLQQVIFLKHFSQCPYVIENVSPYYDEFFRYQLIGRHAFWSNEIIYAREVPQKAGFITTSGKDDILALQDWLGIHWDKSIYMGKNHDPAQVFRNAVHPLIGNAVFQSVMEDRGLFSGAGR